MKRWITYKFFALIVGLLVFVLGVTKSIKKPKKYKTLW